MPALDLRGYFRALFDFGFTSYATTRVVPALYLLFTALYSLAALVVFIGLLMQGGLVTVLAIIFVPLGFLLYLTLARISLELVMILFRIGEDLHALREESGIRQPRATSQPPAAPPL